MLSKFKNILKMGKKLLLAMAQKNVASAED
jgi:hypothetical protein